MQMPGIEQLDRRFSLQSQWSRQLREYIFRHYLKKSIVSVLEVGSGTGSVLACIRDEFRDRTGIIAGVEKNRNAALFSAGKKDAGSICIGMGEMLPFAAGSFDLVCCHYLLLWVRDQEQILREMKRVTASGGICAALAEPCYAEMEAAPAELENLAVLQRDILAKRGADLKCGRKIGDLFYQAGFRKIEYGKYGGAPAGADFLEKEIEQMLRDTETASCLPEPGPDWHYEVPTYFAIAEKEDDE